MVKIIKMLQFLNIGVGNLSTEHLNSISINYATVYSNLQYI